MQAVILAGGLGTRLKPLTQKTPKSMMQVRNKPFLEILLDLLHKNNFKKILLLIGHLPNVITEYFEDGSKFGLDIKYSIEKELLGTAGSLKNSHSLLEDEFILINGDTYLDIDYQSFVKFSKEKKSFLTFVAYDGFPYGDLYYNMKIAESVVKAYSKSNTSSDYNAVDAGIYHVKKQILDYIKDKKYSLEEDVFPKVIEEKKVFVYRTKTKFFDIGTIKGLKRFKLNLNNKNV